MHKPEFSDFREVLDRLAKLYGREKPDDEACELYWNALRDISLDAVKACAALHAKRSKFFPKPSELRPKGLMPAEPTVSDGSHEAQDRRCERRWDELLQTKTALTMWHLLAAYLARVQLMDPSDELHAVRMDFCRGVAKRLLETHGPRWCTHDPHCMHAASVLLGGASIAVAHEQSAAAVAS